jgi:hypothetical protein
MGTPGVSDFLPAEDVIKQQRRGNDTGVILSR